MIEFTAPRLMLLGTLTALATLTLVGGCGAPDGDDGRDTPVQASPAAETAVDSGVYSAAVADPARSESDRARDAGRKPVEVLQFFGIEPGMQVLDMFSGGGYYTEIISRVVGDGGSVTAHNNQAYLGFAGEEINARFADGRLSNVSQLKAENNELDLGSQSFDAITLILAYHDFYYVDPDNGWQEIDGPKLLAEFHEGLRPGGILGVVDHYAAEGAPTETGGTTHRIDKGAVITAMLAAGFELDGESDMLRNTDDDYEVSVFDPSIRGKSDRFVLRFRKPE